MNVALSTDRHHDMIPSYRGVTVHIAMVDISADSSNILYFDFPRNLMFYIREIIRLWVGLILPSLVPIFSRRFEFLSSELYDVILLCQYRQSMHESGYEDQTLLF